MSKTSNYHSNQPFKRNEVYSTFVTSAIISSAPISVNKREMESPMTEKVKHVHSELDFRSVLRIRPFNDIEEAETNVFSLPEKDPHTVYLSRPNNSTNMLYQTKSGEEMAPLSFHFDQIIDSNCSQSRMYDEIGGADMAWDAVESIISLGRNYKEREIKNHVIISLGVSNSGKTYSTFGLDGSNKENEGIIPRIVDDLFASQNDPAMIKFMKENSDMNKGSQLKLECSMVYVHNDRIYDMLGTLREDADTKRESNVLKTIELFETTNRIHKDQSSHLCAMKELKIGRDKNTLDFVVDATKIVCHDREDARKVLSMGMKQGMVSSTRMNKQSSRGHTFISLRPVLISMNNKKLAGSVLTVLDMAGIERTKGNSVSAGPNLRESVAINSTISAMLQCLRAIKNSQSKRAEDESLSPGISSVPKNVSMSIFRQNKLLMLLQPVLLGSKTSGLNFDRVNTSVILFVSVYPGMKDYNEKKMLLSEIDALRGLSVKNATIRRSFTENESFQETYAYDMTNENRNERQITPLALAKLAKRKRTNTPMTLEQKALSNQSTSPSSSKREGGYDQANLSAKKSYEEKCDKFVQKIQSLHEENLRWKSKYETLQKKYHSLQKENREYQQMLEDAEERKNRVLQRQELNIDEREEKKRFLEYQNTRHKQQMLLQPEITRHVEIVEQTKCLASGKIGKNQKVSPFKLSALYSSTPNSEDFKMGDSDDEENTVIKASGTFESSHSA